MIPLHHRDKGYALLGGRGLEIGAFNEPAPVPEGATVTYFDVFSPEESAALFPELDPRSLVKPDILGDLDHDGLRSFEGVSFDFVIANHVIEHVANPVVLVDSIARLVRVGGHVVIAAPDKDYTFDSPREQTSFAHVWGDYRGAVTTNDDSHYVDFLRAVMQDFDALPEQDRLHHIERSRRRREHAHVWKSDGFLRFLETAFARLGWRMHLECQSQGPENRIECFTVWSKSGHSRARRLWHRMVS